MDATHRLVLCVSSSECCSLDMKVRISHKLHRKFGHPGKVPYYYFFGAQIIFAPLILFYPRKENKNYLTLLPLLRMHMKTMTFSMIAVTIVLIVTILNQKEMTP